MQCQSSWAKTEFCNGCWNTIFSHLLIEPNKVILPQPDFCQDAAYIAFVLDERLKMISLDYGRGNKQAGSNERESD